MRKNLRKYLLYGLIIMGVFLCGQQERVIASSAPITDEYAQVKAGEMAPLISLPNLQGLKVPIVVQGKPTVIVALHEFRIKQLMNFQEFYDKNKQTINFCIVSDSNSERIQQTFTAHRFTMPVVLDNQREYIGNYNSTLPSMVIIDKNGIVKYNGTAFVDMKSLDGYIEQLMIEKKGDLLPLLFDPPNYVYPAPPSMNIGDIVTEEHFYDFENNFRNIKYNEKPTILLFWAGFNSSQTLDKTMPVIQSAYESRGSQANFYIINFSDNPTHVQETLDSYNITVPTLFDKYQEANLRYTHSFPSFIIIDQNGVVRYRPYKFINSGQLENIIDSLNSPDDAVLAETVQNITAETMQQAIPYAYQNNVFHCKMILPIGWSVASMTNSEVIYFYRQIPVLHNGEKMAAIMEMRQKNLDGSVQTLTELPNDRLEEIKTNLIKLTKDDIRDKDKVTVEGSIKDIGKHKVVWIVSSGANKVIHVYFLENGYMWWLRVVVPSEYSEAMETQIKEILESFTMI